MYTVLRGVLQRILVRNGLRRDWIVALSYGSQPGCAKGKYRMQYAILLIEIRAQGGPPHLECGHQVGSIPAISTIA